MIIKPRISYFEIRGYSKVYPRVKFWCFISAFYSRNNCSRDNSMVFVNKHLIGQHNHMTWYRLFIIWHNFLTLRHDQQAYYQFHCHGYQIVYKTPESRDRARKSTPSKSVNGLAWRFGVNKSTHDSANSHKSSLSLSWVYSKFIPPIMPGQLWASYSEHNLRFDVAKTLLFLVPEITPDSRENSSFKKLGISMVLWV